MKDQETIGDLEPTTVERIRATKLGISLDWWAVIAAAVLAALTRFNWLPPIKW